MTALTQVVIDWLSEQGWDTRQELGYPVFPGPYVPDEPERAVIITGGGGPGFTTEEPASDASAFQIRVRGPADSPLEAEEQAQLMDRLITRALFPVQVDGVWLLAANRSGSGPSPLPFDPADRRTEFTCNYVLVTGA
jgi:hypothetical protein